MQRYCRRNEKSFKKKMTSFVLQKPKLIVMMRLKKRKLLSSKEKRKLNLWKKYYLSQERRDK